jgi:hypothetical protein
MIKSEPIVSDINNSMTDEFTITIFYNTLNLQIINTLKNMKYDELVFKSAHLASCALLCRYLVGTGGLYNWV